MAKTTRQTAIFGVEDWKRIYTTYREADFQSYDFETLRKSFIDYIRIYYRLHRIIRVRGSLGCDGFHGPGPGFPQRFKHP